MEFTTFNDKGHSVNYPTWHKTTVTFGPSSIDSLTLYQKGKHLYNRWSNTEVSMGNVLMKHQDVKDQKSVTSVCTVDD